MNALVVQEKAEKWSLLKTLVLDSVSSPTTRRVYNMALDEFIKWYQQEPREGFTKATVNAWRAWLEGRKLGSSSIIVRVSAIRKLATEAADNGLMDSNAVAGILRVKSAKTKGVRLGNWLTLPQAQRLLETPDAATLKGLRDRAILATLLGCGLRRSEVANLTFAHLQQRDGRWCIVDLLGKHKRIRTVPLPNWVKSALDRWAESGAIREGPVFRVVSANGAGAIGVTERAVWQMLRKYAETAGMAGIAPHDLRRSFAKFCRVGGGKLEQIQMLLGHASVQTTERYLGTLQNLEQAPNDTIRLKA